MITDFSDLDAVGRQHYMTLEGGCASEEELEQVDGRAAALKLILNKHGTITPYGVVYDNGMELEKFHKEGGPFRTILTGSSSYSWRHPTARAEHTAGSAGQPGKAGTSPVPHRHPGQPHF